MIAFLTQYYRGLGHSQRIKFLAEEVGKILPDIVEFAQDSEYANSMDYIRIISFLVEGVKAQDKKISNLEKKLDLLIEKLDK